MQLIKNKVTVFLAVCLLLTAAAAVPVLALPVHSESVMAAAGSPRTQQVLGQLKIGWPWYVTRASGLVAAGLLVLLVLSGIGQITGLTYRMIEPLTAWRLHRSLGIAFGVSVLIHILVLLLDSFVPFTIIQVLVPFKSAYMPVTIGNIHFGSLYVALGIFALYAAAFVLLTSLFWIDKKPTLWRLVHYLSYVLAALIFFHGLFIGTDLKNGLLRFLWIGGGVLIIIGIVSRLRRSIGKQKGGH